MYSIPSFRRRLIFGVSCPSRTAPDPKSVNFFVVLWMQHLVAQTMNFCLFWSNTHFWVWSTPCGHLCVSTTLSTTTEDARKRRWGRRKCPDGLSWLSCTLLQQTARSARTTKSKQLLLLFQWPLPSSWPSKLGKIFLTNCQPNEGPQGTERVLLLLFARAAIKKVDLGLDSAWPTITAVKIANAIKRHFVAFRFPLLMRCSRRSAFAFQLQIETLITSTHTGRPFLLLAVVDPFLSWWSLVCGHSFWFCCTAWTTCLYKLMQHTHTHTHTHVCVYTWHDLIFEPFQTQFVAVDLFKEGNNLSGPVSLRIKSNYLPSDMLQIIFLFWSALYTFSKHFPALDIWSTGALFCGVLVGWAFGGQLSRWRHK